MRKQYGFWVSGMLTMIVLLAGVLTTPARSQDAAYRLYPTLSLRNFQLPPHTGPKNGVEMVPGPGNGGDRYFLVPVWIWNEVDTNFNNVGIVPPGNNNGQTFGQHLEPIRSFNFQVWYHTQMEQLDTGHGSPIVMTGPSIVDGTGGIGGHAVQSHPDTALAKTFFITWSDQSSGNPNNAFEHIIRIAGASQVPLPENASSDSGYSEHNGILLWLRFKIISPFPGDEMHMDSAMFNDHPGDSIRIEQDPALPWTHGNFGGGINAPDYNINTGHLEVDQTAQPAFELRPLNLIAQLDGPLGPNDSLLPDLVYDPSVSGGSVTRELQLDDAISLTEMSNITITSDQSWLGVGVGTGPSNTRSIFLGWDALDYSQSFGSTVDNLWLSVVNPSSLAPGVYYATVTFTCDGAVNSPFKLRVRFVRLASPNEPSFGSATNTGIRLHLTNSCNPTCENILTFGTGSSATEGIDVLYGEQRVTQEDILGADTNGKCIAYFKPMNPNADTAFQNPDFVGLTRDIRSATTDSTLIYQVVFNPGNVNCYPEKVCVDPADFPAGGRIVMKFTLNGSEQGIDLRNATVDANGMECVTISDHRIDSFFIEYTPGISVSEGAFLKLNSWTLISLPVIPPDNRTSVIFPTSVGQVAWSYASSSAWNQANTLQFGRGYMIRYSDIITHNDSFVVGVKSYSVNGVAISQGWNTIGGTSGPGSLVDPNTTLTFTPVTSGSPVPSLLTTDNVTPWMWEFTPQHGYDQTVFFTPGKGYFIKVDHSGFYNLTTPAPVQSNHQNTPPAGKISPRETLLNTLTHVYVSDAQQNGQDLYFGQSATTVPESRFEMPGNFRSFDARFDANSGMMSYNHNSYVVDLHATSYPVTMQFSNLNGSATVTDMNGNLIGNVGNNGTVTITSPVTQIRIAEKQDGVPTNVLSYALEANSPNPFPQSTLINYTVPQETAVSLVVYNALGQPVQTLVDGTVAAGAHQVQFDGRTLPSGTYYYTLKAGNFVQTQTMNLQH